jgi:hypothetical protein
MITAVTVAPVLNENPEGALRTIVPLPEDMACAVASVTVGPTSAVHVAVPFAVLASALMALPPVAGVTVTAAKTLRAPARNKIAAVAAKRAVFLSLNFIFGGGN